MYNISLTSEKIHVNKLSFPIMIYNGILYFIMALAEGIKNSTTLNKYFLPFRKRERVL